MELGSICEKAAGPWEIGRITSACGGFCLALDFSIRTTWRRGRNEGRTMSVNEEGMRGQAAGAPVAPTPAAPVSFLDRAAAWLRTPEGKFTACLVGVSALLIGGSALANRRDGDGDDDDDDLLAANREEGALYEQEVGGVLEEVYSDKEVLSQVSVKTPSGKKRRADYVIAHQNGAMTAVEVKKVSKVTEKMVRQAEEEREGLRHTFGAKAGRTLLVVPEDAEVRPEFAARVRVRRHG
jgi:hypothetical protein